MNKYKPKTIDDIIFESPTQKKKITDITTAKSIFPNCRKTGLLLHGMPGTGKTALAQLLPEAIEAILPFGNIKTVRPQEIWCEIGSNGVKVLESIKDRTLYPIYASDAGMYYFVLHEADNLTPVALKQLKTIMETARKSVFILTTNNLKAFEPALLSRCEVVSFNPTEAKIWLPRMLQVLADEQVTGFSPQYLMSLVERRNFDAGSIFWELEKLVNDSRLEPDMN